MDIKRLVIGIALALALTLGWQYFVMKPMYDRHPEWKKPGQPEAVNTGVPSSTQPGVLPATTQSAVAGATTQGTAPAPGTAEIKSAPEAVTASLGSATHADPKFAMEAASTGRGGGIGSVVLNDFYATVEKKAPYRFQDPALKPLPSDAPVVTVSPEMADLLRPLATRSVTVNGQAYDLHDKNWTLENKTESTATYRIEVGPVAVRKTFDVRTREAGPTGRNGYEVAVTQTIENTGKQPASVATVIQGPISPLREIDSTDDRQVIAGYQADGTVLAVGHAFSSFSHEKPSLDMTKDKNNRPVTWFGASSVYFNAIVRPLPAPEGQGKTMPLRSVNAETLNASDKEVNSDRYIHSDQYLIATSLQTDSVSLAPGEKAVLPMEVFFGPKQRSLLNNAYYSAPPLGYDSTLSTNLSGCGTYCTFGWLINLLVALLGFFHMIVRDWGLSIILLVAVVRICLHPITKRSQISMLKMGKMGPEIERLKAKYKDDKEELNRQMMQVYKEQGATPILGCLPMFLQMPIWVALYSSLQNTFELRQEGFLQFGSWGLTWIHDLAKPDRLFYFPNHPVNLFFIHFDAINLLPILMAVVFWLQQKFTPKPPANTPEQEQQQKMMQWMSLLFPVFLYNGPAGLNLYILTSTAVGILESKRIRDHIKQRELAEKEGRIIVEPTRKMRRSGGGDDQGQGARRESKSPKGGGLAGWLADLQQKAEEMRQQQQKKK